MLQKSQRLKLSGLCLLFLLIQMTLQSTVLGQNDTTIWLPLVIKPADNTNTNPVIEGIATYYSAADGTGTCSFDPSPDNLMVAAMNNDQWDDAALCGAYIQVTGALGTVMVRIVNRCPECTYGHVDLSPQAFAEIDEIINGRVPVTWQIVSPPVEGPISWHFKDGSHQWWSAVQVRNHRNPIAKFEYLNEDNQWITVSRTYYNFFVQTRPGMGVGPYTFRITDIYGNVIVNEGIGFIEDGVVEGVGQFPAGP